MNWIGFEKSALGQETIAGFDPTTSKILDSTYPVATPEEADLALKKAAAAFPKFAALPAQRRAEFLKAIAEAIESLGDELVQTAMQETGLPETRILGERGRTAAQLRMFAQHIEAGNWVEAVIDTALPDRKPLPRPDIRRMLVPTGTVVVFAPANFPLAFSTAGGDTASALAAGCPVVVKAHEGHPGTHALVADAIVRAARKTEMPDGVFSSLFGKGHSLGQQLVQHPLTKNVAFTGSLAGGRALFDLAAARLEPIPVFAEMSSVNPVFVLPEKIRENPDGLAAALAASVNLNAGQFCTNPGIIVLLENAETAAFLEKLIHAFGQHPAQTMLTPHIFQNYQEKSVLAKDQKGVVMLCENLSENGNTAGTPRLASIAGRDFLKNSRLHAEVFGPFSLLVRCRSKSEMLDVANTFSSQLTASIHATEKEVSAWQNLLHSLENRAGRVVFNGVPTGVEVCAAMMHGGGYPATTDGRFTSVGTGAIRRFVRPLCFQNYPEKKLPPALRNSNPLKIWRSVDGIFTKSKVR